MDRDGIERRDFPTGRRGYDTQAVDEHLRRVADAFESQQAPPAAPSLASSTAEQVQHILEAAEQSVAEVQAQAGREAADHVAAVQEATSGMLSKLDQLEGELNKLLSALRASGERLSEGLAALQSDVAHGVTSPVPDFVPAEFTAPAGGSPPAADSPPATGSPPAAGSPPASAAAPDSPAPPAPDSPAAPAADSPPAATNGHADDAGARLIALNMALSGEPRDVTARYLREHFDLPDLEALLDDVYARAGQ